MASETDAAEHIGRPASGVRPRLTAPSPATALMLAALVAGAALLLYATRNLNFFYDEWDMVQHRRGGGLGIYLDPINGHLSLLPLIFYKVMFELVGMRHYWLYEAAVIALHLTCCWLLYVLGRRRIGPWPALVPPFILLVLGSSYENLLWAIQVSYVGSVAAGLGALLLLEHRTRRSDVWASVLLVVAYCSSSLGIPLLIGVAVELALGANARRRIWVAGAPVALYLVWRAAFGEGSDLITDNIPGASQYVVDSLAAAAAGASGLSLAYGAPVLIAAVLGVLLVRREAPVDRRPLPSPRVAGIAFALAGYYGLTALARGQLGEPEANRYVYAGVVLLMLLAVTVLPRPTRFTRWGVSVVAVLTFAAMWANVGALRQGERTLRGNWDAVRPVLAAAEVAGASGQPDRRPATQIAPQVIVGPYLEAVGDLGSPTGGLGWLADEASEPRRQAADAELVAAERIVPEAVPDDTASSAGRALDVVDSADASVTRRGACVAVRPAAERGTVDVRVAPGRAVTFRSGSAPVELRFRRFADEFLVPSQGEVPPRVRAAIRFPKDRAKNPWIVRVTATALVVGCTL